MRIKNVRGLEIGLENREQLVESFNEVLQVLDKELISVLFEDRNLKGKEDKFLYLHYTDVDELFTLYYDDEFGDGLNIELFKLDIEDISFRVIIVGLMGALAGKGVLVGKMEKESLKTISKLLDLVNIELDWLLRSNEALKKLLLDQEKQGVN